MPATRNYWFPAKRYGWGWGPPRTWQGWVVLALYVAAMALIVMRVPPTSNIALFMLLVTAATAVMVLVCWLTGEPPSWRWGDDDSPGPPVR
jgi:uncharacterized membrane protein YhaH (DUF805 family)